MPQQNYIDGYPGDAVAISQAPRQYPLRKYGNVTHAVYTRKYQQALASFTPSPIGMEDPLASGFYLTDESVPEIDQGILAEFTRTFANVPSSHESPVSVLYSRPPIPYSATETSVGNEPTNAGLIRKYSATGTDGQLYTRRAVASDTLFGSAPTGGNYVLSVKGYNTSSLAYNASTSTVAAAFNAITQLSTCAITAGYQSSTGKYVFSYEDDNASVRGNENSYPITEYGVSGYASPAMSGTIGTIASPANSAAITGTTTYSYFGEIATAYVRSFINYRTNSPAPTVSIANLTYEGTVTASINETSAGSNIYRLSFNTSSGRITGGYITLSFWGQSVNIQADDSMTVGDVHRAFNALGVSFNYILQYRNFGDTGQNSPFTVSGMSTDFANVRGYIEPTSGSWSFTWGAATINIAYNATQAQIISAIQAMAPWATFSGMGGVLNVYRAIGYIRIGLFVSMGSITSPSNTLTPAGSSVAIADGRIVTLVSSTPRTITTTYPHGLTQGQAVYAKQGSTYYYATTGVSVVSPTQIQIAPGSTGWPASAASEIGGFITSYDSTPKQYSGAMLTEYWRTGQGSGYSSALDIPAASDVADPTTFILAHFAANPVVTVESGQLEEYLGGMYMRESKVIKLH